MDKCVGQIIVDRLNNDSSRIYALRGIEIVINSSANLDNVREVVLSAVIPLVKKTMSDVKKTTLQVLKAFVVRYQTEVSSSFEEIAQAGLYGISKDNLQVSEYALDLMSELTKHNISRGILEETIGQSITISEAEFLLENSIQKILEFFSATAQNVKDLDYKKIIAELEQEVKGVKNSLTAKCIAQIIANFPDLASEYINHYHSGLTGDNENKLRSAIIIGEIGRNVDLSSLGDIIELVKTLFNDDNNDIRAAASQCLGSISSGNVGFFFPKILHMIRENAPHKHGLLQAVKDVIQSHKEQIDQLDELNTVLFENATSTEEIIRNVSAECLGRLFVHHGTEMIFAFDENIKSTNQKMLITLSKALKNSCFRNQDSESIKEILPGFIDLCEHADHIIRAYALEGIASVANHKPKLLKPHAAKLVEIVQKESVFRQELVIEHDLGAMKHKTDEGRPLRQAAFQVLSIMLEKIPDKVLTNTVIEIAMNSLQNKDEKDPDCRSSALHILSRLVKITPGVVLGQLSNILPVCHTIIKSQTKASKAGGATNLMRNSLKLVLTCSSLPDIATNSQYHDFMMTLKNDSVLSAIIDDINGK